jgi:metal-dependent amidase/aminoacylase/carboxypeptidase family protein
LPIEEIKSRIIADAEANRDELCGLSRRIHDNPELGFHEFKAAEWLTAILQKNGFALERGVYGLDTAFRASYGKGGPVIALLAEYDALPAGSWLRSQRCHVLGAPVSPPGGGRRFGGKWLW